MFIYKEMEDTKAKELGGRYIKGKRHTVSRTRSQFTGAIQTLSNRCRNSRFREKHRNHFEKVKQLKEKIVRAIPFTTLSTGRFRFLKTAETLRYLLGNAARKTPLTIRLIEENEYRAGIFVVPATLLYTWEAEIKSGVVGNV